jgi:hypothetical protein
LQKRTWIFAQHNWQNILWTDETTVELFARNTHNTMCGEKKGTAHQKTSKTYPNCKVW